jgi:drug/metabolite transporter (DMT)-like permease
MPQLFGILVAFGTPLFHGVSNILDSHLSNKLFERLTPLVFLSSLVAVIGLPIIWLIDAPQMLSLSLLGVVFLIAGIEIAYLYPYFWSLRKTDASVVACLFSLGRLFVPVLAFIFIGERLALLQYLGIGLIVFSSIFLTFDAKKLRLNAAFFLMLFVAAILAVQAILYKYLFEAGTSWGTFVSWMTIFELVIASVALCLPGNIASLRASLKNVRTSGKLFAANEFLGWAGNMTSYYAATLIPISIAKAISSTQPLFVLLVSSLFAKKYPEFITEKADKTSILRKAPFFLLMALGAAFIVS